MSKKQNNLQIAREEKIKEVIEAQKEATVRDIITAEMHLEFKEVEYKKMKKGATDKTVLENLAKQRQQFIIPLKENIEHKSKYYEYLCELSDTESVEVEKQTDTSEKH